MITSAVVIVVALLAVVTMLVAKSRRGTRLATAGYVDPLPSTPAPALDDPYPRAIETAAPVEHHEQATPHPGTGTPVPGSGTDPEETASWTPPFKPYIPPGSLEWLFTSKPRDHVADPQETSAFDPFAPAETDPDYQGRRRRSEDPATDEDADDDTPPGETGHSTP
jgi:hypothetical protein